MDCFVIRIYRYSPEDDSQMVGTCQRVESLRPETFKNQGELIGLIKKYMDENAQLEDYLQ